MLTKRYYSPIFALLLCAVLVACGTVNAQDNPIPTPLPEIIELGYSNVGDVLPISLDEVAQRTGIQFWRNAHWTGLGQRVGVLDRGFGGLRTFETQQNVTTVTAYNDDKAVYDANHIRHGTQVLEIIHEFAPGAELHVCQYDSFDTFIVCIDWMVLNRVNIVNHSAGVPALPLDGQGRWALEVNRAAQAGILWINAAGNFANGYISEALTDRNTNGLHEFGGVSGEVEALGIESFVTLTNGVIMLSWLTNDDRPANTIDMDLQVINSSTGEVLGGSYQQQNGDPGQQPLEILRINMNQPFAVQIIDASGDAAGVTFSLFVEFARLQGGSTLSSIIAPADAVNSLTVAALRGFEVAPYSSRGPLINGSVKPNIAAPGEIILGDGSSFFGTSAAAPVVAAAAALIWEANPNLNRAEISSIITNYVQPPAGVTADYAVGNGRLLLPLADSTAVPTLTYTPSPSSTPTPTPTLTYTPSITPTQTYTHTPTLTNTPTNTHTPTATNTPTITPTPTLTLTPTETLTSTPTRDPQFPPDPATQGLIYFEDKNVRTGPDTVYALIQGASGTFIVTGQNNGWYAIDFSGIVGWVRADLVEVIYLPSDGLRIIVAPPSPTPTPTRRGDDDESGEYVGEPETSTP